MDINLHHLNIAIHVIAGSTALIIGLITMLLPKTKIHARVGRTFLKLMTLTVATGLTGVLVYGRNAFLLVITILSGYVAFSGYRVIKRRSNAPQALDITVALLSILVVFYFLYYFSKIGMIWSPVIVYSTVGYLCMVVTYDLLRYNIPPAVYAKLWIHEHIFKMVSAFSGLLSAFTGTVFPAYQPYSQFLPSIFGLLIIFYFICIVSMKKLKRTGHKALL